MNDHRYDISYVAVFAGFVGFIAFIAGVIWLICTSITLTNGTYEHTARITAVDIAPKDIVICLSLMFSGGALLCTSPFIHRYFHKRYARLEYLESHADLNLSMFTILKVVSYMRKTTSYPNIRFGTVASALIKYCRNPVQGIRPDSDPFPREVFTIYQHFQDKRRYPLPKSMLPSK